MQGNRGKKAAKGGAEEGGAANQGRRQVNHLLLRLPMEPSLDGNSATYMHPTLQRC